MENSDNNNSGYYQDDKTEPYQPAPQPARPAEEQQPHPYAPPAQNRSYPPQQGSDAGQGQYYREYMEPQAYQPSSYSSSPSHPLSNGYQPPASTYSSPSQPVPADPGMSGTVNGTSNRTTGQGYAQGGYVPYAGNGGALAAQRPNRSGGSRAFAFIALVLVLLVILGVGLFAGWQFGHAQTATTGSSTSNNGSLQTGSSSQVSIPKLTGTNLQSVQEAVVSKTRPAVVQITVETASGEALGSGVIIDKRGYIITNNHVVNGATTITVALSDGTTVKNVQVVGTDTSDDLALVKITPPNNMAVVTLGDSSKLVVGQNVLAIGNPLGNTQTVTNGIVSALGRNVSEDNGVTIPNAIQTDAPINPGNSGGALVDLNGNLVGIPTLTAVDPEFNAPANGVGFAIPSNQVSLIATQLIATGKVTHTGRAAIGISPVDVTAQVQSEDNLSVDHGVLIQQLVSGGAAQKAGLQVGDVIVQIDNSQITSTQDLENVLIADNPGDTVTVHVYRGAKQLSVQATLGELAAKN
jgi:S1-C subfamily serine protease